MSKILVAYFSPTSTTKRVAEELAQIEGADLFEITPAQVYTAEDLDWRNEKSRSTVEMNDPNCRPEMVGKVDDIASYDTIFLGYPCWWGTMPMACYTFLEHYDLADKKIIPFCTHEGSGMGGSVKEIKKTCPKAIVADGLPIHGAEAAQSEGEVMAWAKNHV